MSLLLDADQVDDSALYQNIVWCKFHITRLDSTHYAHSSCVTNIINDHQDVVIKLLISPSHHRACLNGNITILIIAHHRISTYNILISSSGNQLMSNVISNSNTTTTFHVSALCEFYTLFHL